MPSERETLAELEEKLLGIYRPCLQNQRVIDRDHIPIRTGIPGVKFLKHGPKHILEAPLHEPLYTPQENIIEDCLRRDAERVASQDTLVNRVVYDSVDPDAGKPTAANAQEEQKEQEVPEWQEGKIPAAPTPNNCDNDADFEPWWKLKDKNDTTL